MSNEDRFNGIERRLGLLEDDMKRLRETDTDRATDIATITERLGNVVSLLEKGWDRRMQYAVLAIALVSMLLNIYVVFVA